MEIVKDPVTKEIVEAETGEVVKLERTDKWRVAALFSLPVHPAADVWPMLTSDELDSLAASIREVGLLQPIVTWIDGDNKKWLLDGRNRLEACRRADLKPTETLYKGDDPGLYVLGANEHRRHSTPSQRAMAVAQTVTARVGNPQFRKNAELVTGKDAADRAQVAPRLIDSCRYVIEHAPDLVPAVLAGTIKAAAAEAEARRRVAEVRRMEAESARRLDEFGKDLDVVKKHAPDLAERWATTGDDEEADPDDGAQQDVQEEWRARIGNATSAARRLKEDLATIAEVLPFLRTTPIETLHLAYEFGRDVPQVTVDEITHSVSQMEQTIPVLRDFANRWGGSTDA